MHANHGTRNWNIFVHGVQAATRHLLPNGSINRASPLAGKAPFWRSLLSTSTSAVFLCHPSKRERDKSLTRNNFQHVFVRVRFPHCSTPALLAGCGLTRVEFGQRRGTAYRRGKRHLSSRPGRRDSDKRFEFVCKRPKDECDGHKTREASSV